MNSKTDELKSRALLNLNRYTDDIESVKIGYWIRQLFYKSGHQHTSYFHFDVVPTLTLDTLRACQRGSIKEIT